MKSSEIRAALADQIEEWVAAAREQNNRIEYCNPGTPGPITRVFVFETEFGFDWGTTREEFGEIEPILSVPIAEYRK